MKRPQKVSKVPKKEVFCKRPQKRRVVETPGIYIYIYEGWLDKGAQLREPRIENRDSRIENQESRVERRESRIENRELRIENRESRTENRQSRIDKRESRSKNGESFMEDTSVRS